MRSQSIWTIVKMQLIDRWHLSSWDSFLLGKYLNLRFRSRITNNGYYYLKKIVTYCKYFTYSDCINGYSILEVRWCKTHKFISNSIVQCDIVWMRYWWGPINIFNVLSDSIQYACLIDINGWGGVLNLDSKRFLVSVPLENVVHGKRLRWQTHYQKLHLLAQFTQLPYSPHTLYLCIIYARKQCTLPKFQLRLNAHQAHSVFFLRFRQEA